MNYVGTLWTNSDMEIMVCVNAYGDGWLTLMQITPPDPTASKMHMHVCSIPRYYRPYLPTTPLPPDTPYMNWMRR